MTTRDELVAAARRLLEAEARWQAVATEHGEIVNRIANGSSRTDMPAGHGLEDVITALRRANLEIPSPAPHWAGRRAHEEEQNRVKLMVLGRKSDRTEADELEAGRLRRELRAPETPAA